MSAYINYIDYYLPEKILSNADIENDHPEWTIDKIALKTGIFNRHISADDEFVSDLAIKACEIFFNKNQQVDKDDIDFLILCTQTPDYLLPSMSCIIQDKLGFKKSTGALDINQGCSGFVYSLGIAKALIESGQAKNVLLITSETYSKLINPLDKSNKTLFGDASAVTLISDKSIGLSLKINEFVFGTDGSGFEKLIVKNGGVRNRAFDSDDEFDDDNYVKNDNNLFMDGRAVFEFTMDVVPKLVNDVLRKNKLEINEVDKFVFHQANRFMLNKIRAKIGILEEKFIFNSENIGNTVSSSIPISLSKELDAHALDKNQNVMICGFGVGLSYAGAVLTKY